MALDLRPAPGRFPIQLSARWTAVFIEPLPGVLALGLFLDGASVEIVTEPDDVRGHLTLLGSRRASSGELIVSPTRPPVRQPSLADSPSGRWSWTPCSTDGPHTR
jgi:hypothetical protein